MESLEREGGFFTALKKRKAWKKMTVLLRFCNNSKAWKGGDDL